MKRGRETRRPQEWTREQLDAVTWTPEHLAEARKRWDLNKAGPKEPKQDV